MTVRCISSRSRFANMMYVVAAVWGAATMYGRGVAQTAASHQSGVTAQMQPSTARALSPADAATLKSLRKSIDTGHAADALQQIAALRAQRSAGAPMPGLNLVEGLAYYAESNLKAADASFAEALVDDPKDVEAAQMRGLTLFGLGHPNEAIPLLQFASAKGSLGKTDPNYLLALCYMDSHRYDDARHAFAAQFGFAPDSADAYLVAARMLLRREYLPIAQSFAERAVALSPTLPLAHELLGEIALAGNHLDEAIAEFEKERTRNPVEPSIYDRLGDAYTRAARYDDAQRSLQEAVLLEPNATGPYILLGKIMLKKGDPIAAVTYLQRAEHMDPANYITHSLLGQAFRGIGRIDDAAREAGTAEKLQNATEPKLATAN
jgi:tetratricopeptide (TPR) repeat protein